MHDRRLCKLGDCGGKIKNGWGLARGGGFERLPRSLKFSVFRFRGGVGQAVRKGEIGLGEELVAEGGGGEGSAYAEGGGVDGEDQDVARGDRQARLERGG